MPPDSPGPVRLEAPPAHALPPLPAPRALLLGHWAGVLLVAGVLSRVLLSLIGLAIGSSASARRAAPTRHHRGHRRWCGRGVATEPRPAAAASLAGAAKAHPVLLLHRRCPRGAHLPVLPDRQRTHAVEFQFLPGKGETGGPSGAGTGVRRHGGRRTAADAHAGGCARPADPQGECWRAHLSGAVHRAAADERRHTHRRAHRRRLGSRHAPIVDSRVVAASGPVCRCRAGQRRGGRCGGRAPDRPQRVVDWHRRDDVAGRRRGPSVGRCHSWRDSGGDRHPARRPRANESVQRRPVRRA